MARKIYPKLPDLPDVTEGALDSFDCYLSAVIDQAHAGVQAGKRAMRSFDDDWIKEQTAYWQHGRSILKWLRGQIRRQRQIRAERKAKADRGRT